MDWNTHNNTRILVRKRVFLFPVILGENCAQRRVGRPGRRAVVVGAAAAAAGATLLLGSWGKSTRDAVRNKERWKRRRSPTQDPSTAAAAAAAARCSSICPARRSTSWPTCVCAARGARTQGAPPPHVSQCGGQCSAGWLAVWLGTARARGRAVASHAAPGCLAAVSRNVATP